MSDEIPQGTLPSRPVLELTPLDVVHVDVLSDDVKKVSPVSREELEVPRMTKPMQSYLLLWFYLGNKNNRLGNNFRLESRRLIKLVPMEVHLHVLYEYVLPQPLNTDFFLDRSGIPHSRLS